MSSLFTRIDTVFVRVRDLDAAARWYTETLGFAERFRSDWIVVLNASETALTLIRPERTEDFCPAIEAPFNFYVPDVQRAHDHLLSRDVETGPISDGGDVLWFWFKDPDGNQLEVCHF
jgi:catechol 2,3-dioxygenase-like lactoylglutathione lyase family enzyme